MNEILSWLAWGIGAIVLVAVVVAGWEHLVREARGRRRFHRSAAQRVTARTLAVDVRLDTQAAALGPEASDAPETPEAKEQAELSTDRQSRLAAMTEALSRAADPNRTPPDRLRWADTTPRVVGLGEPALGQRDRPPERGRNPHA